MNYNYLRMNWDVKIYLAKIKDGKGRDFKFPAKKSLLTTIRPKSGEQAVFNPGSGFKSGLNFHHDLERIAEGLSQFYAP